MKKAEESIVTTSRDYLEGFLKRNIQEEKEIVNLYDDNDDLF